MGKIYKVDFLDWTEKHITIQSGKPLTDLFTEIKEDSEYIKAVYSVYSIDTKTTEIIDMWEDGDFFPTTEIE